MVSEILDLDYLSWLTLEQENTMERDPAGQLAWLVSELEGAEQAGERVWIMGHMPLGKADAFHDQSQYYG